MGRNGDVANEIGAFHLSVLMRQNSVPVFFAAPILTFDISFESVDGLFLAVM
ncbi:MAG: hypothetical protein ACE5JS_14585 [Nitrospinota bacterium]